jgi:hypothetical protein
MKTIKLLFGLLIVGITLTSCIIETDNYYDNPISIEEVITNYDIWYVDYNSTTGVGDVPFLSKAFTITFSNGRMFANNNIVGIGYTGNGYGIQIGTYSTSGGMLQVQHSLDGYYEFEVIVDSSQSIRLYDSYNRVTYYLEGYHSATFNYDQIFYDNLEYFLQEYDEWRKTYTSIEGELNAFDNENFLAFTPENIRTFYSSIDDITIPISDRYWDFTGDYVVANINGYDDIKDLTLYYENGDTEAFELSVIDDAAISLYHYASGTIYEFDGTGYIQYRIVGKDAKTSTEQGGKRFKVQRKTIERKQRSTSKKAEHIKDIKIKAPARK